MASKQKVEPVPREITKDGVIVIDEDELTASDVIEIMRSRDDYLGWKRDGDKRIAELEAAAHAVVNATVDGGSGTIRLPDRDSTRLLLATLKSTLNRK